MAIRFSMFTVPEHKKFNYKPRIWDPEKEDREAREKRVREELGLADKTADGKTYVPDLRNSLRREIARTRKSKPKTGLNRVRSLMFVVTVVLLAVMLVFIMKIFPYLFPAEYDGRDRMEYPKTEIYE
ncbi:MAG: hypothetical protein LBG92_10805 [Prevotellaceae bacterium]|jgi:hypothetical protein|nr:hypothetical protein [Prevotellaceae bacterium]